jgi:hypothetical protein
MATENIYTGRRPKDVLMGTLYRLISNGRIDHVRSRMDLPDKITESQNQNADASELHGLCESTMEVSDVEWKLRSKCKGAKPLREGYQARCRDCRDLPPDGPVQGIRRIIAWLGNKDVVRVTALDEMVGPYVSHDLCAR